LQGLSGGFVEGAGRPCLEGEVVAGGGSIAEFELPGGHRYEDAVLRARARRETVVRPGFAFRWTVFAGWLGGLARPGEGGPGAAFPQAGTDFLAQLVS
jgi:hypothetical protein